MAALSKMGQQNTTILRNATMLPFLGEETKDDIKAVLNPIDATEVVRKTFKKGLTENLDTVLGPDGYDVPARELIQEKIQQKVDEFVPTKDSIQKVPAKDTALTHFLPQVSQRYRVEKQIYRRHSDKRKNKRKSLRKSTSNMRKKRLRRSKLKKSKTRRKKSTEHLLGM